MSTLLLLLCSTRLRQGGSFGEVWKERVEAVPPESERGPWTVWLLLWRQLFNWIVEGYEKGEAAAEEGGGEGEGAMLLRKQPDEVVAACRQGF